MAIDALSEQEQLGKGEKPWCDLVFDIVDVRKASNDHILSGRPSIAFRTLGTVPMGDIGFEIEIPLHDWKPQALDEKLTVFWGRISFRSAGLQTDLLLRCYENWFELPVSGARASHEIRCLAVLIGASPGQLAKSKISTKIFFDGSDEQSEESYAELFFDFDLSARRAWLREKDPDYRGPLASWIAGHHRQANESLH